MELKENVRKMLKESGLKKFIIKNIDEYGLDITAKIMSTDIFKLLKISEMSINHRLASILFSENPFTDNLKRTYKKFKIRFGGGGGDTIEWKCEIKSDSFPPNMTLNVYVMATPFWDGSSFTPVEVDWFLLVDDKDKVFYQQDGGGNYYRNFNDKKSFNNVDELADWYHNTYLPKIYEIITDDFLPKIIQTVDDHLDEQMGYY